MKWGKLDPRCNAYQYVVQRWWKGSESKLNALVKQWTWSRFTRMIFAKMEQVTRDYGEKHCTKVTRFMQDT